MAAWSDLCVDRRSEGAKQGAPRLVVAQVGSGTQVGDNTTQVGDTMGRLWPSRRTGGWR